MLAIRLIQNKDELKRLLFDIFIDSRGLEDFSYKTKLDLTEIEDIDDAPIAAILQILVHQFLVDYYSKGILPTQNMYFYVIHGYPTDDSTDEDFVFQVVGGLS
jgi:hypothetical protein